MCSAGEGKYATLEFDNGFWLLVTAGEVDKSYVDNRPPDGAGQKALTYTRNNCCKFCKFRILKVSHKFLKIADYPMHSHVFLHKSKT